MKLEFANYHLIFHVRKISSTAKDNLVWANQNSSKASELPKPATNSLNAEVCVENKIV